MTILLTADPELPVPPTLYGGIERIIDSLVKNYTAQGHAVTLMAHPDSKVPCRLVPWKGARSDGWKNIFNNTGQLFSHVLTNRYDVLHSFSRLAYLGPLLRLNLPKVMSYQREPTLSQVKRAAQLAKDGSLAFTGCSDYITNQLKPFNQAFTVYNCVEFDTYHLTEAVAEDAPLVFLGRIEPIKGTHIAVDVARRTNRRLIIAGNIPAEAKAYFDNEIAPFLNERIQYIGAVNDRQKNELLGQAAAFLMPIQWNEPFGIVMAEAMACGTPVLGFPSGSVPEVVEHGLTGFHCTDVADMADKVEAVRQLSRKKVHERCRQRFSSDTIAADYLRLYASLQTPAKQKSV